MKRYISMAIIAAVIPSICMGYSAKYNQLVSEKQRKMAELEECSGNVNGWKIAGISTLGLTAVGVAGNVALANKSKDYDKQIEKTEKSIESYDQKITAQKQEKMRQAEEEANKSACEQSGGKWENSNCTCPQDKPLNGNRCGEPGATTTSAAADGTDCTEEAKQKDDKVTGAKREGNKCVVQTCIAEYTVNRHENKCEEKLEKIQALSTVDVPVKINMEELRQNEPADGKPDDKKSSEKKKSSTGSGGSSQAKKCKSGEKEYNVGETIQDGYGGTVKCQKDGTWEQIAEKAPAKKNEDKSCKVAWDSANKYANGNTFTDIGCTPWQSPKSGSCKCTCNSGKWNCVPNDNVCSLNGKNYSPRTSTDVSCSDPEIYISRLANGKTCNCTCGTSGKWGCYIKDCKDGYKRVNNGSWMCEAESSSAKTSEQLKKASDALGTGTPSSKGLSWSVKFKNTTYSGAAECQNNKCYCKYSNKKVFVANVGGSASGCSDKCGEECAYSVAYDPNFRKKFF